MGFHHGFDRAESESETFFAAAFVTSVEALPDAGEVVWGDAEAGVDDFDTDCVVGGLGGERDLAVDRGVFDGVVEEVCEGLLEADSVGGESDVGGELAGEGDGFFFREDGVEVDDFCAELV
ncbi:MAG: hypothetical protein RI897_2682 [Verrucomicrobiota bacterium]